MSDPLISHIVEHTGLYLGGATTFGIIAHAVNTFPTPKNTYGAWLLGLIQFAVGQRVVAKNTLQGLQTQAIGVATDLTQK